MVQIGIVPGKHAIAGGAYLEEAQQTSIDTIASRREIGFPDERSDWTSAEAVYDDHTLRIAGHPVMEDWEAGYMADMAGIACTTGGRVLELGYGMGLSAGFIQKLKPTQHVIVECHPDVALRCYQTFRDEIHDNKIQLILGFWQEVSSFLASEAFDGILFDTYPLSEEEVHSNHYRFFAEAYRLLKPGGIFTYYSDEPVDYSDSHLQKLVEAGWLFELKRAVPGQGVGVSLS